MKKINFKIYSMGIEISSENEELLNSLKNDFGYFEVESLGNQMEKKLTVCVENKEYTELLPKDIISKKQTENSIYYDVGNIRYNDYYGKALSVMNYDLEQVNVYYTNKDFVHELCYLLILSRSGKYMDRKGLHKIHACGVHFKNKNVVLMMPSKGGKTTLFCELVANSEVDIISDDTPVIDQDGNIHPFPLRIGSDSESYLKEKFPYLLESNIEEFKRTRYSKKYLVGIGHLQNNINAGDKTILINGLRSTYDEPNLKKIGKLKMLKYLMSHMVIGIGLPMVVEYFLRNNLKDHLVNFSIMLSRLKAAIQLINRSENYEMYCSTDIQKNKACIWNKLNE